jgi:hypothetical protein
VALELPLLTWREPPDGSEPCLPSWLAAPASLGLASHLLGERSLSSAQVLLVNHVLRLTATMLDVLPGYWQVSCRLPAAGCRCIVCRMLLACRTCHELESPCPAHPAQPCCSQASATWHTRLAPPPPSSC